MEAIIQREWPSQDQKAFWPIIEGFLQGIDWPALAATLGAIAAEAARRALQIGAEHEAARLAPKLQAHADDEEGASISIGFDVQDTAALRYMIQHAADAMKQTTDLVKQRVRDTLTQSAEDGDNVQVAARALRDTIDGLSESHALLVARTEVLHAARAGAQALAESTDIIGGKKWLHSGHSGARARSWHVVMNDVVVLKDAAFVVPRVTDPKQPAGYPKSVMIVGEDSPWNCGCAQQCVLRDDLPKKLDALAHVRGVTVAWTMPRLASADSPRKREVLREHGLPGESFGDMLRRLDASTSRNQITQDLGASSKTLYRWLREAGIVT